MRFKVYGLTTSRIGAKRKAKSVGSALRYAFWEILLLAGFRLQDLFFVQIALIEFGVEVLERQSLDDIERVDDIPQALTHLPTVGVTNHGVAIHLSEGHLPREVKTEHHHTRHPEEKDVPTRLEEG